MLDYEPLEQRGRDIESKLEQKDAQIASLNNQVMKLTQKQDELELIKMQLQGVTLYFVGY